MKRKVIMLLFVAVFALVGALALPGCSVSSDTIDKALELWSEEFEDVRAEDDGTMEGETTGGGVPEDGVAISEDGAYTSKEDVALYLHTYGHLPNNYITKDEAEDEGWKTEGLSLDEACPGMSIGGDRFGNREGLLPSAPGRTWYECDIGYVSGNRNAKRIVYSSDGLIYYTDDHYKSFEQLY